MPIVSGGGGGGAGGGALALISDTTLAADGTFDLQAIPGTYNGLLALMMVRGTRAANSDGVAVRFNNDTAADYAYAQIQWAGAAGGVGAAGTSIIFAQMYASFATAGQFSACELWIPGYASTAFSKSCTGIATGATLNSNQGGGNWSGTAAISRIQVFGATTANFLAASRMWLYGIT